LDRKIFVDVLGHAAVVGSLIFVGIQVQQGAAASRSATVLQLKDSWVQLNLAGATSPELVDAYDTVIAHGWESNARARGLVDAFERARLHNWSNAYYQYRNGTLEEDQWLPHLREIQHNARNQILKKVWSEWDYAFDDEFRRSMDDTLGARAGWRAVPRPIRGGKLWRSCPVLRHRFVLV
jgi:hypothetical protein